jgi:predicted CoA-binding protein
VAVDFSDREGDRVDDALLAARDTELENLEEVPEELDIVEVWREWPHGGGIMPAAARKSRGR